MRVAVLALALVASTQPQRAADDPFVGIGVWYGGPGARPPSTNASDVDALRRDLAAIRRAGFNAITTWVAWRDAEPKRGAYSLAAVERVVAAATEADLRAALVVYAEPPPDWAGADPRAAAAFVDYLSKRLSAQPAVLSVSLATPADQPSARRVVVARGRAPEGRIAMWAGLARGERYVGFAGAEDPLSPDVLSLGETAGVVTRNQALFGPLRPRSGGVRGITGVDASPNVEVRLLESSNAIVIVGLNYAAAPRKVTIAFAPDMPEAIWQNFETGTAVNFVMQKDGPTFEYTFGPSDALVLMIGKRLR
jgi:hypothetical protein